MRNLKLILVFFLCCAAPLHAQSKRFYLEIPDSNNIPTVVVSGGKMTLVFSNNTLTNLFKKYTITDFKIAIPGAVTPALQIVYNIECDNALIAEIAMSYSSYFGNHYEIIPDQPLFTPNDLGGVSGALYDQSYLTFINAPAAWDLSHGDGVTIGTGEIVDISHPELSGKSEVVVGTSPSTPTSATHGTQVAVAATGSTNNSTGIASIGYNCAIKSAHGTTNLIAVAENGARVINYSMGSCGGTGSPYDQGIIDELWNIRGVMLVAAAGNGRGSCPAGANLYHYPAALNHVFAVTGIGHRSTADSTTDGNRMDIFENPNTTPYLGTPATLTYNDRVDLSAPGFNVTYPISHTTYASSGFGTSLAAPLVTGTVGLMFQVNPCIYPDEVESILKLTAYKNDTLPLNLPYEGLIGAGRLDAFAAVDMANDMALPFGIVEVHDRIINRWDFNLRTSPYKIKMTNNTLTGNATINFTAKNDIDVISGDYNPGASGWVDLKIKPVNAECNTPIVLYPRVSAANNTGNDNATATKLAPNPNQGDFNILVSNKHSGEIKITIYDILGKIVQQHSVIGVTVDFTMSNLPSGMYFVKLASSQFNETIKFIKE